MKPATTTTSHLFLDVQAFTLMEDGSIYRTQEDNISVEWREKPDTPTEFRLIRENTILYSGRAIKEVLLCGDKSFMLAQPDKSMTIIRELAPQNSAFWYFYFQKIGWPWQI